jgi:hypothetical protein
MNVLIGVGIGVVLAVVGWWVYRVEKAIRPRPFVASRDTVTMVPDGSVTPEQRNRVRDKITSRFGVSGAQADQAADEVARALQAVPRGR